MRSSMIDSDDPGGMAFYPEIAEVFDRMEQEKKPECSGESNKQCLALIKRLLDHHGTMPVFVGLASILADKSVDCRHYEWLSSNFNVLVNRAMEHQTDQYNFPFGL